MTNFTSIDIGHGKQKFFRFYGGSYRHRHCEMSRKIGIKQDCPEIDDYIDYERSLIVGDFDKLADGFEDWDAHHAYIKAKYGHMCFVYRSFSGKTKVFLVAKGIHLSDRIKRDTLKTIFGEDCEGMGFQHNDMSQSYLKPEYFAGLGKFIRSAEPIEPIRDHTFKQVNLPNSILSDQNEPVREVIAFIVSFGHKALDGVDCPQRYIAEVNSRSQSTIFKALHDAEAMGLIECVDASTKIGVKGATYRMDRFFFTSVSAALCSAVLAGGSPKNLYLAPPLTLRAGGWYSGLWKATNYFFDATSFMAWAESESDDPGKHHERMRMAYRAWRNHAEAA